MIRNERNFQLQLSAFILICCVGIYHNISSIEWSLILLISALVLSLEAINSSIEKVCNLVTTKIHPEIKIIKDIASGAVVIASVIAIIIGCLIFFPYLIE